MQHEMPPDGSPIYAGFWIRLFALVVDTLVLAGALLAVGFTAGVAMGVQGAAVDPSTLDLTFALLAFAGSWLYTALCHASSAQATIGKHLLGLRVVDRAGRRLTFARATGRFFATILSGFPFYLGYLIAGVHRRKNALHDTISGTHVVHRADFAHWSAAASMPVGVFVPTPRPAVAPGRSLSDWVPPAPVFDDDRDDVRELGMSQVVGRPE